MLNNMFKIIFTFFLINNSLIYAQNPSLHEAVIRRDRNLTQFLLKKKADVNQKNRDGMNALHLVSDPMIALDLLVNGADINATNRVGSTPLHWAVSHNNTMVAQLLLEFGADVNKKDNKGNAPLHLSVYSLPEIVLLLIRSGADVNSTNQNGDTPLLVALANNKTDISKFLTIAGARDIQNQNIISPSILATLDKTPDIKVGLQERTDPLVSAIFVENYPEAIRLINSQIPLDGVDISGNSPLHWSLLKKNRYVSRLLLEKDANYSAYNNNAQTPIDVLLGTQDTNFINYIQSLLKDKTNFIR